VRYRVFDAPERCNDTASPETDELGRKATLANKRRLCPPSFAGSDKHERPTLSDCSPQRIDSSQLVGVQKAAVLKSRDLSGVAYFAVADKMNQRDAMLAKGCF
jgi:hypothetical protein